MRGGAGACARAADEHGRGAMSAAEIIEMIKKLPPEEVIEVREFFQRAELPASESKIEYASDEEFDQAAKTVLADNQELLRRLAQ